MEYLEVGIIIGDDLKKWLPVGDSRDKQRETLRKARGVMLWDLNAMRVSTPTTEHLATQTKYHVDARPTRGRCFLRTIAQNVILFYPEIWRGLPQHVTKNGRREHIAKTTKHFAALHKTPTVRRTAAVTFDDMAKRASSHVLAVTLLESTIAMLVLQLTKFKETRYRLYIDAMLSTMESAAMDLKFGSFIAIDGIKAFHALDEEDSTEFDAENVLRELPVQMTTIHSRFHQSR